MTNLIEQIKEKGFRPAIFIVYNIMDEDGFILELEGMFKKKFSIDDFEYMVFDLSISEKNAIIYYISKASKKFTDLKKFIEVDIQPDVNKLRSKIYIKNEEGIVFLVKLKDFDLIDAIKKTDYEGKY